MYIGRLLKYAFRGKNKIAEQDIVKLARGISGPWAHLDLPMEERVFDFGDDEMRGRVKSRQRQRRYRKSMENYHSPGVGEGHYWREIRNEPFSWYDRESEDPYPHRNVLQR